MRIVQRIGCLVAVVLLAVACTVAEDSGSASPAAGGAAASPGPAAPDATAAPDDVGGFVPFSPPSEPGDPPPPDDGQLAVERIEGADPVALSAAVSRTRHDAAQAVVVVPAGSVADATAGAPLAAALDVPLLATASDRLSAPTRRELERLGADEAIVIGGVATQVVDDLAGVGVDVEEITGPDRTATAALVAERMPPVGRVYVVGARDAPAGLAAAAAGARLGAPVLLVEAADGLDDRVADAIGQLRPTQVVIVGQSGSVPSAVRAQLAARGHAVTRVAADTTEALSAEVAEELAEAAGAPGQWVVAAAGTTADGAAALSASAATGAPLLLVPAADPAASEEVASVLAGGAGRALLVGDALSDQAPRQLRAAAAGNLLPRGGTVLFPAYRMIAYYGNAQYAVLGVLGETPPQEAAEIVEGIAAQYEDGERQVLPAFELIVSIATAGAGADGQYSALGPVADARRYLEAARAEGMYLFLDFQPGRNRFLEQIEEYEELLREPDVGVAIDPEWRMTDSERPGQVIGSVEAEEVNEVAEYLAEIVREHDLPQKLFVVHQFRFDMIDDRDQVITPPELATTIHVDGFGTQELKLETWNALAESDAPWFHGFKLFYDEDTNLFAPEQVLDFEDPPVDLVTYQ